jgi:hypothetical protein
VNEAPGASGGQKSEGKLYYFSQFDRDVIDESKREKSISKMAENFKNV